MGSSSQQSDLASVWVKVSTDRWSAAGEELQGLHVSTSLFASSSPFSGFRQRVGLGLFFF